MDKGRGGGQVENIGRVGGRATQGRKGDERENRHSKGDRTTTQQGGRSQWDKLVLDPRGKFDKEREKELQKRTQK